MNFVTELREGMGISWGAIRANKMRSVLATLGIVIGIVTVTLMGAAIEGLNRSFVQSISAMGADVLFVQRYNWASRTEADWMKMQKRKKINLVQSMAVKEQLTLSQAVAPQATTRRPVKYKNRNANDAYIVGTTEEFAITSGITVDAGRFLSSAEVDAGRAVCVLGEQVATNLFQRESPLGNMVKISGRSFEVVGVLERRGSFMGRFSLDNQVMVPLKQFTTGFWNTPDFTLQIKVNDIKQLDEAREEVRSVLRRVRHLEPAEEDDFAINEQGMFLDMFYAVAGTIAAVGLFITGLSLFVGGIGIMNIMFVSVAERTREIGIRKAIGAKRRTILLQFIIEAACICLIGGSIALAIAWTLTLLVGKFVPPTTFPMFLSGKVAVISLVVSGVTGVASGFLPAWRAARMNPVDALRSE